MYYTSAYFCRINITMCIFMYIISIVTLPENKGDDEQSYDRAIAHLEVLRSDPNTYCTIPEGGCGCLITINNYSCGWVWFR